MPSRRSRLPTPRPTHGAKQPAHYGAYAAADMDAALLRSQSSDPLAVGLRLLGIGVVYALLGHAVANGLSSPYLLLPLWFELFVATWMGWLMARTVVPCPTFRRSGGSLFAMLVWSGVLLVPPALALAWDPVAGTLDPFRIPDGSRLAWHTVLASGLHWALLAAAGGLALSSIGEVLAWRRQGGVFVWTSLSTMSTRIALVFALAALAGIPLIFLGGLLKDLVARSSWLPLLSEGLWAWPVWTVLLLLDVGVVLVLALMHRDLRREQAAAGAARQPAAQG